MAGRTLADITGVKTPSSSVLAAPWPYMLAGVIILLIACWAALGGSSEAAQGQQARNQARQAVEQLERVVQEVKEMLRQDAVQAMAEQVRDGGSLSASLLAELRRLIPEVTDVHVYGPEVFMTDLGAIGDNGFIMLDMMAAAMDDELSPVQFIEADGLSYVAGASTIGRAVQGKGFMVVYLDPAYLLNLFSVNDPAAGYIGLEHKSGANAPVKLKEIGTGLPAGRSAQRLNVPGSMLQVVYPVKQGSVLIGFQEQLVLFLLGGLLLLFGFVRRRVLRSSVPEGESTMPERFETLRDGDTAGNTAPPTLAGQRQEPKLSPPEKAGNRLADDGDDGPGRSSGDGARPDPALQPPPAPKRASEPPTPEDRPGARDPGVSEEPPLVGRISQPATQDEASLASFLGTGSEADSGNPAAPPAPPAAPAPPAPGRSPAPAASPGPGGGTGVALSSQIFRAYDIRGVVGETLDHGIAFQLGQAIGSHAVDSLAPTVVVGRDGRHSGPDLVDGLVSGLNSVGCSVIDIGAVPTGVLYYAACELARGSGVMVTGSHNPPDYNGFKIMIGGRTLAGDDIFGLFERLRSGNLRSGKGSSTARDVLEDYRDRIAGDIQLERPLKVVADCGNGIGGVCATEVLRAIGAEVISLYDEVDGDFPNHHPDPSDPETLEDLKQSVRLTGAELGVAFDGDADRVGVVTPDGNIIYADRLMMLFIPEILGRNPGQTILYDVKCTGHLERIIQEAGGTPEMYKTGHSLMKNRMKEVDAPFAGEMSGHFFFEDRWYGFDCGIYSACRLLEILARESASPQEVLGALPDSVSTPELKVQLREGENHAFMERFREQAEFPEARITTIDGLRADFDDGWGLVRASNTTPILVLRFDADSEEALTRIQEAFRTQLLAVDPDLDLPF